MGLFTELSNITMSRGDFFKAIIVSDAEKVKYYLRHHPTAANIRHPLTDRPALTIAAIHANAEIIHMLINNGANIDYHSDKMDTALIQASWHGNCDTVKALLDHHADTNIKSTSGSTALGLAEARYSLSNRENYAHILEMLKNYKHAHRQNTHLTHC